MYDAVFFLLLLNVGPSLLIGCALLRKNEATLFVFERKNESFDSFSERNDVVRVDVILDCKFTRWNDAFCLITEFKQDAVAVDLDNSASDKLAIL